MYNGGRYVNARLDAIVDAIRVEPDLAKRRALTRDALAIIHADLPLIPLYRRTLAWAMRQDVDVAIWPNDILDLRFVRIARP
jgi:peptide/nickel transport system substrate-binding protein